MEELARFLEGAQAPALVVGGADDAESWKALVGLAERLVAPVFQESFGARAGFPRTTDSSRACFRRTVRGCASDSHPTTRSSWSARPPSASRRTPGRFTEPGTRIAIVGDNADEVQRSPAELAVLAPPASVCRASPNVSRSGTRHAGAVPTSAGPGSSCCGRAASGRTRARCTRRTASDEAVVVEEAPVDRPELHDRLLARRPLGFLSAAMGGLGFALAGATGVRMALPERPVVAVVGDGSALYGIQALWSAAHYGVGPLFVILSNGGYAIMDRLAERQGGRGAWPAFNVDIAGLARAQGCDAKRISEHGELVETLDDVIPTLTHRDQPLLLDVVIAPTQSFAP